MSAMTTRPPKSGASISIPRRARLAAAAVALALLTAGGAYAETKEVVVAPDARTAVAVTIYNDNVAFVQEQRRVDLKAGRNVLALSGVSPSMQPATASVLANAPDTATLVDQTFAFDLLTPDSLLKHSVGRTVRIIRTHPTTGEETVEIAKVLSTRNGIVLQIGDRIETTIPGRIAYDTLPATLRESPTLLASFDVKQPTTTALDLHYLTGGLTWQADYVAKLDASETTLSLQAVATITNNSGAAFGDAALRLVAGSINQGPQDRPQAVRALSARKETAALAAPVPPQPAGDMHIYRIPDKTSLDDRATKQIVLFRAPAVPVSKEYRIEGNGSFYTRRFGNPLTMNAERLFRFNNAEKGGLGIPMPAGTIRVFGKADGSGGTFFGADRIGHTPDGAEVRLRLGQAFDITAKRKQTDFRKQGLPKNAYESTHEIMIGNATDKAVTVKIIERMPGDWKILESSGKHQKPASDRAEWSITVPSKGETKLTYKVRVQL